MSVVELLQSHHDRKSFDCGKPELNGFLQRQARQNADRNLGVTHVVVRAAGSFRILGFYTLVTRTIERALIPTNSLPGGPIGVVLLGRLAVDLSFRRQGLGREMLLRALRQTEEASRVIGIYALVLDALDDDARQWYQSLAWGFQSLHDDPRHLFIPISTIRQLDL